MTGKGSQLGDIRPVVLLVNVGRVILMQGLVSQALSVEQQAVIAVEYQRRVEHGQCRVGLVMLYQVGGPVRAVATVGPYQQRVA